MKLTQRYCNQCTDYPRFSHFGRRSQEEPGRSRRKKNKGKLVKDIEKTCKRLEEKNSSGVFLTITRPADFGKSSMRLHPESAGATLALSAQPRPFATSSDACSSSVCSSCVLLSLRLPATILAAEIYQRSHGIWQLELVC